MIKSSLTLAKIKQLQEKDRTALFCHALDAIDLLLEELSFERRTVIAEQTSTEGTYVACAAMYYNISSEVIVKFLGKTDSHLSADKSIEKLGEVLLKEQHRWSDKFTPNKPAIIKCKDGNYVRYFYWNGWAIIDPKMQKGKEVRELLPEQLNNVIQGNEQSYFQPDTTQSV